MKIYVHLCVGICNKDSLCSLLGTVWDLRNDCQPVCTYRPLGERCRQRTISPLMSSSSFTRTVRETKSLDVCEIFEEIRQSQRGRRNSWRYEYIILTRRMKVVITFKLHRRYLLITGIIETIIERTCESVTTSGHFIICHRMNPVLLVIQFNLNSLKMGFIFDRILPKLIYS